MVGQNPSLGNSTSSPAPRYELRVQEHISSNSRYEIWQVPAPSTPQVKSAVRLAGLGGRNLQLIEHQVLRRLSRAGIRFGASTHRGAKGFALGEEQALSLGLLFRTLAPMKSRDRMRMVAQGIEAMEQEEAAYWLGMAMHRRHPRRVLSALRILLSDPRRTNGGP